MDQELLDLINRMRGETAAQAEGAEPFDGQALSDDELSGLLATLRDIAGEVDAEHASDDDLALLDEVAAVYEEAEAMSAARAAAAAERAERARERQARINPTQAADGGGESESGEGDGGEGDGGAGSSEGGEAAETASGGPASTGHVPTISHLAHRMRPDRNKRPRFTDTQQRPRLVAAAGLGLPADEDPDLERWAIAASRKLGQLQMVKSDHRLDGDGERISLATISYLDQFPEERMFTSDEKFNEERRRAMLAPDALAASGGVCGPVDVSYDVASIGSAERPVRDQFAMRFGAGRGGLRYVRPFKLTDSVFANASQVWTQATDAAPGGSTKAHATYTCQTVQEDYVDAVTAIAQVGNFQARYFPELLAQFLEVIDVNHARVAEATLLANVVAGSTAINMGIAASHTGVASELLAELDRDFAAVRNRNRMAPEAPLRIAYPEWLEDAIRADLARELPGNSGGQSERLAVADGEIDRFFAVRNVNVTNFLDSPTGFTPSQNFVSQGAGGDLVPWPDKALIIVTHEGAWTFLDGGEINLGAIRDSVLNSTNDMQFFSETMEKAIFRGHFSHAVTFDFCVSGARAAVVDTTGLCATGS